MTSAKQLSETGQHHHLAQHLGNPDATIVSAERYIVIRPTRNMAGSHYPDLLVAFDVDPELYEANNGYIISEQGKPPDFVLEIASRHTGHVDVGEKREAYAAIGIGEYWRFDETGQYHGTRLAGDRLVGDRYVPIDIDELAADVLQGYSAALHLHLRWERGEFGLYVPETGLHIATFASERPGASGNVPGASKPRLSPTRNGPRVSRPKRGCVKWKRNSGGCAATEIVRKGICPASASRRCWGW